MLNVNIILYSAVCTVHQKLNAATHTKVKESLHTLAKVS